MNVIQMMTAAAALVALAACDPDASGGNVGGPVTSTDGLGGVYDIRPDQCGKAQSETRLTIAADRFDFYESSCTASQVDGASGQVTLACIGEGQQFNRSVRIEKIAQGLRMIDDEITLTYQRCGDTGAPMVTPAPAEAAAAAEAEVADM